MSTCGQWFNVSRQKSFQTLINIWKSGKHIILVTLNPFTLQVATNYIFSLYRFKDFFINLVNIICFGSQIVNLTWNNIIVNLINIYLINELLVEKHKLKVFVLRRLPASSEPVVFASMVKLQIEHNLNSPLEPHDA